MLLEGVFLPLTTPFDADGGLFLRKLESNVRRYSLTPSAGMLIGSHVGEGPALTDSECQAVFETAISAAADEKVMLATVARESVHASLALMEVAARAGYDAVVLRAPRFVVDDRRTSEVEIFFETIADRSPLPLVIAADQVAIAALAGLAEHPQIIGAMETSQSRIVELLAATTGIRREVQVTTVFAAVTGRMMRHSGSENVVSAAQLGAGGGSAQAFTPMLKTRRKTIGFQVLSASTAGMLAAWQAGASGAVPSFGPCAPQACCEVWQAFRDGDEALATEKQTRLHAVAALTESRQGTPSIKFGCDVNGYYGGPVRLPLLRLNEDGRQSMTGAMAGLNT